ncbi:hypothetical protein [Streptomyces sp. NPDC098781]|uniref:hypothetical protein n=1 Tax=Streptomyces sp. NPDC098781 TaxID=3366097 RepID=UPI003813AA6C
MDDKRREAPGETPEPVPRDLPDQQATGGEDPWEVPVGPTDGATEADDVPDTDEAGTGRQGSSRSDTVHPEHPAPEEPTA